MFKLKKLTRFYFTVCNEGASHCFYEKLEEWHINEAKRIMLYISVSIASGKCVGSFLNK